MFGIILAISFGVVIVLIVIYYVLKCRTLRHLPHDLDAPPLPNQASREISLATISSNPRMQTFPAGPPAPGGQPPAAAVYPVANVNLADTPVGAPTYQPPPLETLPPTPPRTPSAHDFDL